jgi:hypothetical protein
MTDKTTNGPQEAQGDPRSVQEASDGELAGRGGDRGAEAGSGGSAAVHITVHAPTAENASQWAQTIADLVTAEHGQDMRLDIRVDEAASPPPTGTQRLARLRDQLAAEHAKAERADQAAAGRPDLNDLRITPHNGIAAGLAIALFLADHHLREADALAPAGEWLTAGTRDQSIPEHDDGPTAHDGGPTVAECADTDRRWWNGEKAGE